MNSLEDSSLEECKRAIEEEPFLSAYYEIGDKYIKSRDGRIWFTFVGLDRNVASIKSKGRILILWVDEAEPVTDEAWTVVIPTLREEGEGWNAELWVTWNRKRKTRRLKSASGRSKDPRIKIVELNWRDNPKFPAKLERERQRDLVERPEQYDHIWEGDYVTVVEGAYFASHLTKAKADGRIGKVAADPLLTLRALVDIGGTGAKADNFVIWIDQIVGREIRVLDHYEAQGQPIEAHLIWLRSKGYVPGKVTIWLPTTGRRRTRCMTCPTAAPLRLLGMRWRLCRTRARERRASALRRCGAVFPSYWFNERPPRACGLRSVGITRNGTRSAGSGLGLNHDWASHTADAMGLALWRMPLRACSR
jgi:phage terminase large subunit